MDALTVALDIGTSKVACVAATEGDDGLIEVASMAYMASQGVERGVVTDIDALRTVVSAVIGKIERHLNADIKNVWCSVGGAHLVSHTGQGVTPIVPSTRSVRRQDVHAVVGHSRQALLPADRMQVFAAPREFILDGQRGISDPIGMSGGRLEVMTHIVTGGTEQILNVEEAVVTTKRKVMGMAPTSVGSALGVLSDEMMDLGCVVVDIGAGKTDVSVVMDGALAYQSCIKIGGDHFTWDLAQLLKAEFMEAERLKVESGSALAEMAKDGEIVSVKQADAAQPRALNRKVLCEIIESRGKELCQHIWSACDEGGFGSRLPKMVVLTGGGSELDGIDKLFEQNMMFTRRQVLGPKVSGPFAKQAASPTLSTVVGLARYAIDSSVSDLEPISGFSTWKERISTFGKKIWFGQKS